ncbi:cysteine desulfurase family protein [Caldicoprobacter faecalis]|uniref:cysteine desulfurase n=1 Tax=Caldicoprobacter faecalis TaxID=937334 RepID=A0A1I5UFZ3_9FIRM|nr:cysteine desulfurase family protein [Caldicoprobacter faecalis]
MVIYMDNAATSWPKPKSVYRAVLNCMKRYGANPGRSGHKMAIEAGKILLHTRKMLCQLFSIDNPFQMIFTLNATESLNLAIKGCTKPGDHIITTSMEHNSVVRPLKELEKYDIKTTYVKADSQGRIDPHDIKKAIRTNTRLIVTTHASNVTGTLVPIDEIGKIAREYGILYLVDAAQTAGIIPIDLSKLPVDMMAMAGHKGLLGPQGTGVLYIAPHVKLKPLKEGGTGSQSENLYQPEFAPDRYEAGTQNTPGIAGLGAGISYILQQGQKKLLSHIIRLEKFFLEAVSHIPGIKIYGPTNMDERIGAISINIKDFDSAYIANLLDERYNIATRGAIHCAPLAHQTIGTLKQGTVRFSPGIFNTMDEVKECIRALEQLSHLK